MFFNTTNLFLWTKQKFNMQQQPAEEGLLFRL